MNPMHIWTFGIIANLLLAQPQLRADDHDHDHDHAQERGGEKGHDHGHEDMSSKFGPGKAIEAVKDEGAYFKLSEKAIATIGVTLATVEITKPNTFEVPRSALVHSQDETGIYVQRGGWFEMVPVKRSQPVGTHALVVAPGLRKGDKIAVGGVPFLRIAHLEALGQGGQGHVH